MALKLYHAPPTTGAGVEITTARQGVAFVSNAEEGSTGVTGLVVDDANSVLEYVGRHRFFAYETAALAHNQVVYNGYFQERAVGRGPTEGMDGDVEVFGRRWDISIADTNSLLSRRLITGADGNRPAESDIDRINWLLSANNKYLSNPADNWEYPSTYVSTTGPISMSAADLRGQTAYDVLNDCAQRSGKNFHVIYNETFDTVPPTNAGKYSLWYDFDYSTAYTSTVRLTNVFADVDNVTTFFAAPDLLLRRTADRNYSGVYLTYATGSIYVQSTAVANLFQQRDAAVNNPNVKTAAEATALANRYLADAEGEDDRLTCRYVCAKQYVNDLREGQRFQAQFTHLTTTAAAYGSAYTYWRVLNRTVRQMNDEFYEIAMEVTPLPCTNSVSQYKSSGILTQGFGTSIATTLNAAPAVGSLLVAVLYLSNDPDDAPPSTVVWPADWTQRHFGIVDPAGGGYIEGSIAIRSHIVTAADTATLTLTRGAGFANSACLDVIEIGCGLTVDQVVYAESVGPTITVPSITTTDDALLLGFHLRMTSAAPRNTPAGWTVLGTAWQDLGSRELVATYSRSVAAGTLASATFEGGVEGGNTAGVVIVEIPG